MGGTGKVEAQTESREIGFGGEGGGGGVSFVGCRGTVRGGVGWVVWHRWGVVRVLGSR